MNKSLSVTSTSSFTSDQLEELDLTQEDLEYDVAPFDVYGEHGNVGKILVVRAGDTLPLTTKYKRGISGEPPVKFHVSKTLEVVAVEYVSKTIKEQIVHVNPPEDLPPFANPPPKEKLVVRPTSSSNTREELPGVTSSQENASGVEEEGRVQEDPHHKVVEKRFFSASEFVTNIENNFEVEIIGGLEAGLRCSVSDKMKNNVPLLPKENNAIVNSILQAVFDQYGPERPDKKFCEKLADVLKAKFPSTYRITSSVQTSLGSLALPKSKGEGGYGTLARRLGDNFYNRMVRPTVKRPVGDGVEGAVEELGLAKKKKKGGYCLSGEKWNIDASASKAEKEEALRSYMMLETANSLVEKKEIVQKATIFIQKQFRELEPGQAVEDLKSFWGAGIEILSVWFEWLTGGSRIGSLAVSATQQITKVLNIVEQFLISKKGADFERAIKESEDTSEQDTGNNLLHQVFLLRHLIKFFKNKPAKLIFLDGLDEKKDGPDETDPNILIIKQNTFGTAEYDQKVSVHLRIGDKTVFSDISLPEALAGVIQIHFCFNTLYSPDLDDSLQFVERILCVFGSHDGARNKKNGVRKGFRELEVMFSEFLSCT